MARSAPRYSTFFVFFFSYLGFFSPIAEKLIVPQSLSNLVFSPVFPPFLCSLISTAEFIPDRGDPPYPPPHLPSPWTLTFSSPFLVARSSPWAVHDRLEISVRFSLSFPFSFLGMVRIARGSHPLIFSYFQCGFFPFSFRLLLARRWLQCFRPLERHRFFLVPEMFCAGFGAFLLGSSYSYYRIRLFFFFSWIRPSPCILAVLRPPPPPPCFRWAVRWRPGVAWCSFGSSISCAAFSSFMKFALLNGCRWFFFKRL